MLSNVREKYYAGADSNLHGGDGHVSPLLLLAKSPLKLQQCRREERTTRPVCQLSRLVGERKHPAMMTTLIMIVVLMPKRNNGEERITRLCYRTIVDTSVASWVKCKGLITCGCLLRWATTCWPSLCLYHPPLLHHLPSSCRMSHKNNWKTLLLSTVFSTGSCCFPFPRCCPTFFDIHPVPLVFWCWSVIHCSISIIQCSCRSLLRSVPFIFLPI